MHGIWIDGRNVTSRFYFQLFTVGARLHEILADLGEGAMIVDQEKLEWMQHTITEMMDVLDDGIQAEGATAEWLQGKPTQGPQRVGAPEFHDDIDAQWDR